MCKLFDNLLTAAAALGEGEMSVTFERECLRPRHKGEQRSLTEPLSERNR